MGVPARSFKLHIDRNRFQQQRSAAKKLQSIARGFLSREHVRVMMTVRTLADELWRLRKIREREHLELVSLNDDNKFLRRSKMAFASATRKTAQNQFKVRPLGNGCHTRAHTHTHTHTYIRISNECPISAAYLRLLCMCL